MKTRLQRFLADCGVASRRESEAMILSGRVRVNGEVRILMPVLIDPEHDIVTVDDEEIGADVGAPLKEQEKVYFLLNKPKGILVTNSDPSNRKTVGELMTGIKQRVFPVGRLDMDSRGALIMTNDGELANRLTHPRYGIEKTYIVEVDGRLGHDDLEKIKRGMWLGPQRGAGRGTERGTGVPPVKRTAENDRPHANKHGQDAHATRHQAFKTERFKVKLVGRERGRTILELKISEAKNSDIRRVMARLGHNVRDLNRVAIGEGAGKITTKGIDPGQFRPLSPSEIKWLFHASSPDFHQEQRAATQSWFEQKEMEKERKRLESDAKAARLRPALPAKTNAAKSKFRVRPEPKGKKPFVPPSGRNAGKALGGNFRGQQRFQRERQAESPPPASFHEDSAAIKSEVRAIHPLGENARSDE